MPGQTIGTVNVQVGPTQNPRVNNITYGGRTLKSATDLSLSGAATDDVISYVANTNSFVIKSDASLTPTLDAGFF
jgi:hypothetical protein